MSQENVEIVRRAFEAWNRASDARRSLALLIPTSSGVSPWRTGAGRTGTTAVRRILASGGESATGTSFDVEPDGVHRRGRRTSS